MGEPSICAVVLSFRAPVPSCSSLIDSISHLIPGLKLHCANPLWAPKPRFWSRAGRRKQLICMQIGCQGVGRVARATGNVQTARAPPFFGRPTRRASGEWAPIARYNGPHETGNSILAPKIASSTAFPRWLASFTWFRAEASTSRQSSRVG